MATLEGAMRKNFSSPNGRLWFCVFYLLSFLLISQHIALADPDTTKSNSSHLALAVPYHNGKVAPSHSVSLFFGESQIYIGEMLCSDRARNIYIFDRVSPNQCVLKKFSMTGKLLWSWPVNLDGAGDGISAAVLPDGKIWFNLGIGGSPGTQGGLPLVILQPNRSKPVADWRLSTPPNILKALYSSVNSKVWQKMPVQMQRDTRTWMITEMIHSEERLLIEAVNLTSEDNGDGKKSGVVGSQKLAWQLMFSGDGKKLAQTQPISGETPNVRSTHLGSNGAIWYSQTDALVRPEKWANLWLWKNGTAKGISLLTRADLNQPREPWQKLIGVQAQQPPRVSLDEKGNIYLHWQRKFVGSERRFVSGEDSWLREPMGEDYGQRALVVLDSNRKFVTSVPWTTCYYQSGNWVFPVPDGSGFYRQEFGEKALNIYWHPLPNFKAPSPTKPSPTKKSGKTSGKKPSPKR